MEEKQITQQESLLLITEMINKAKTSFHENGSSAILWGSIIAFCGLIAKPIPLSVSQSMTRENGSVLFSEISINK